MRPHRILVAAALCAGALMLPAAAGGAAPWSAAVAIQNSADGFPDLVFPPTGTGFAGWSVGGLDPAPGLHGVPVTQGGGVGSARRLTTGMRATRFGAYRPNRVIVVGARHASVPRPLWSIGRTSGALGAPRPLAGSRRGYAADLAVNETGTAAAVLRLCESAKRCRRPAPYLVVRRPNGQFGRPIPLAARGPVSTMAVAINRRGDVLAMFDRPLKGATGTRGIYARIRTAGGRMGGIRRLGTSQPIPRLSVAIGAGRRAVVGWLGQRIGEGTPRSTGDVWIASAEPGRRFGAPQRVERVPNLGTGRYVGQAGVRVEIAADGRKIAAWTGYDGGRFVVRAAGIAGGELREPAQVVSDPAQDTVLADLASGPKGEAVVLGLSGIRGSDPATSPPAVGIVAAARPPGTAAFGALEVVADAAGFREAVRAEIAPLTGRAVAVWRDLNSQSIQLASRDPAA